MAKGGGGEGHYDERRRAAAAKPKTFKADSPEVLAAITKPRAKPVVKKKTRVKVESDSGAVAEPGTRMTTTRLNTEARQPMFLDRPKPSLRPGAQRAEDRMRDPVSEEYPIRPQVLRSELRAQKPLYQGSNRAAKGNWGGGYTPQMDRDAENTQGPASLFTRLTDVLPRIKRRNAMKLLDT